MPASDLGNNEELIVKMGDLRKYRVLENNYQYWGIFYDEKTGEYYVATQRDRPPGKACLVSYFAGGKFTALERARDIVSHHARRLSQLKQQRKGK